MNKIKYLFALSALTTLLSCAPINSQTSGLPPIPESLNREITAFEVADWQNKSLELPKEPTVGIPVVLDPVTIRRTLLEGNTSIILGANRIHQAREQLNLVRANLFPSLN